MRHLPAIPGNQGVAERALGLLGEQVIDAAEAVGELTLRVQREAAASVLEALRDAPDLSFEQLVDIAGADYPDRPERFEVNYHLLSMRHNRRVRVKVSTDEAAPVPSVTGLFPNAGWLEREVWDCYGVWFQGNPDLRRILTDYGFEGHPFRKDFPLSGHVELRYSEEAGRVVYEPVKLKQDFRNFDFLSPWEGQWKLPGDEKADENAEEAPRSVTP
jgi:NADH-quinone oxidoreductase subunit C